MMAALAKRSLSQADTALQEYGISLIERMPTIPSEHDADIIHLLAGIARGTNAAQKERADKLLRKVAEPDLSAKAKETLQEYLSPPQEGASS